MSDIARPRVCLIYTGGTIGMVEGDFGGLRPPDDPKDFLYVAPELEEIVDLEFVALLNKDSTNMLPGDWSLMAQAIYERRDAGYSGFVVAHGTDTMHFSASATAFALGGALPFPVVFTGAQTIATVRHGDARINLVRACKVATENLAEVVIAFGDYVFRGCRAQKKDERRFDAFESPAQFPLGFITQDILLTPLANPRPPAPPSQEWRIRPRFAEGVLQVSLIPGLEPALLRPALERPECKGIILQSFGAGNVPNVDPYSFADIIREATAAYKPVVVTSQFPANATLHTSYEPGRAAVRAGAIPTGNMTASCSVAKFRWAMAWAEDEGVELADRIDFVREVMGTVFVDEMDSV